MTGTLAGAVDRLNSREKVLLAALVFFVLPLGLYFLVAVPLQDKRSQTREQLSLVQSEYRWVLARHEEWSAVDKLGQTPEQYDPVGLAGIEAALSQQDLRSRVRNLENTDAGGITLRLDPVAFTQVARFLEYLDQTSGYDIKSLGMTATESAGDVELTLDLIPAVSP